MRALRWAPALLAVAPLWAQSRDDAPSADAIRITHFALHRGDATLITTPAGRHILIDAGAATSNLAATLDSAGVDTLDLVIATATSEDHIGGMTRVFDTFVVRRYVANDARCTTALCNRTRDAAAIEPSLERVSAQLQDVTIDDVALTILPPDAPGSAHEPSVGVHLKFGAFSALYAGDSRNRQLTEWIANDLVEPVDMVTAPDHGSTSGVNWRWMTSAQPSVVVVSVGRETPFAHASWLTVELWKMLTARVVRTDREGTIRVSATPDGVFQLTNETNP